MSPSQCPSKSPFNTVSMVMGTFTGKMGCTPILSVVVSVKKDHKNADVEGSVNGVLLCRITPVSHGRPLPRSRTACPRSCQCQAAQSSPDDGSSNASSADDIL